jgi:hypothetical protein
LLKDKTKEEKAVISRGGGWRRQTAPTRGRCHKESRNEQARVCRGCKKITNILVIKKYEVLLNFFLIYFQKYY